ncbi:MAG: hypothetical protein ACTSRW_10365 [Candidatus Helarchaeota archaeon]
MPQRIYCRKCGFILYNSQELICPSEILKRFGDECPRCHKTLSFNPQLVSISR